MARQFRWTDGWGLVASTGVALAVALGGSWVAGPGGEPGVRALIRLTAQIAVGLFLLAFVASAAHRVRPSRTTAWLLRNRRYVGVSFAVAHTCHLAMISVRAANWPRFLSEDGRLQAAIGGGIAYIFIFAMAATSFDRSVAWLGARRFKLLHGVGSHYIWLLFTLSYARRAPTSLGYLLATALLLSALSLRLFARFEPGWRAPKTT
jgi:sulfoxide reductase heme-binding subunit YedZ